MVLQMVQAVGTAGSGNQQGEITIGHEAMEDRYNFMHQRFSEANDRLDRMNLHFKQKASEVMADENTVRLLARIVESHSLQYSQLSVGQEGVALARLAASGFCELGHSRVEATETGERFIATLGQD